MSSTFSKALYRKNFILFLKLILFIMTLSFDLDLVLTFVHELHKIHLNIETNWLPVICEVKIADLWAMSASGRLTALQEVV